MIFIDACFARPTPYTPVWMMRQAGRYLPQYRALRATTANFVEFCKNSQKAAEATLQPIEALDVDAAILFSDILVVPMEMGMDLSFQSGEGPVFSAPVNSLSELDKLNSDKAIQNLKYVYDTIKICRRELSLNKALIGFCGAPWTLATYMVEGRGSKTYATIKKMLYANPQLLHAILRKITTALKGYLAEQIAAGVDAVMIFDSWAGALEESAYLEFGFSYIKELCKHIKALNSQIPIIVFPKGVSEFADKLDADFDVLGIDWSANISRAKAAIGDKYVLQGNLEPCRLYSTFAIQEGVDEILRIMRGRRHIFNLGHGILPDIPVENAKFFIDYVKQESAKYCK